VYSLGQHTRAVVGGSHPTPSDNSELDGFVPCLFSHLIPIQKFCRPEENLFNLANLHPSETRSMVDLTEIEKQTLRKTLVVDRKVKVQELAERAREVLELDDQGTAYLRVPREQLSDSQLVGLQLTGRKLASLIEVKSNDLMTAEELTSATGIPYKPLTARISELRKKGWIESPERGKYRVVFGAIDELLAEIKRQR